MLLKEREREERGFAEITCAGPPIIPHHKVIHSHGGGDMVVVDIVGVITYSLTCLTQLKNHSISFAKKIKKTLCVKLKRCDKLQNFLEKAMQKPKSI